MASSWNSNFTSSVNIGSDEMVTIYPFFNGVNQLVAMVAEIAGKKIRVKHIPGPTGVRGRNSDSCGEQSGGWMREEG